jgi:hypothetical protein
LTDIHLDKVEKYSITNQKITIEPSLTDTSSAAFSLIIPPVNLLSSSKIDHPVRPRKSGFSPVPVPALPRWRALVFSRQHSRQDPGTDLVKPLYSGRYGIITLNIENQT